MERLQEAFCKGVKLKLKSKRFGFGTYLVIFYFVKILDAKDRTSNVV